MVRCLVGPKQDVLSGVRLMQQRHSLLQAVGGGVGPVHRQDGRRLLCGSGHVRLVSIHHVVNACNTRKLCQGHAPWEAGALRRGSLTAATMQRGCALLRCSFPPLACIQPYNPLVWPKTACHLLVLMAFMSENLSSPRERLTLLSVREKHLTAHCAGPDAGAWRQRLAAASC